MVGTPEPELRHAPRIPKPYTSINPEPWTPNHKQPLHCTHLCSSCSRCCGYRDLHTLCVQALSADDRAESSELFGLFSHVFVLFQMCFAFARFLQLCFGVLWYVKLFLAVLA